MRSHRALARHRQGLRRDRVPASAQRPCPSRQGSWLPGFVPESRTTGTGVRLPRNIPRRLRSPDVPASFRAAPATGPYWQASGASPVAHGCSVRSPLRGPWGTTTGGGEPVAGSASPSLDEHLREFATGWAGMRKKIVSSFSPVEQQAFNNLASEHQREDFFIVRAFARAAARNGEKDFAIARASLADRLSITPPSAADVVRKLCELQVIAQTQPYVRHKTPARFCWLPPRSV